ncbi:MAG: helix-turn-helix domain-containing protein, partial [Actinomycetota bacterium]
AVGTLLRDWRQRRRMSQLDLAGEAAVSARHLSFVETGRSKPSRELILHLAQHLDVPLRERNALLLAGGYAPVYAEHKLDDEAMAPVREALDRVLASHEPYPAIVVDRRWNIVSTNQTALTLMGANVAPELLVPPINGLRISLHPEGLARFITNLGEYSAHVLHRLHQQAVLSQDPEVAALYDELRGYPGVEETSPAVFEPAALIFTTLRLRLDGQDLAFFSTLATFGTALDVTLAELSIESFFPADPETEAALRPT